jgi:hypothetical protein
MELAISQQGNKLRESRDKDLKKNYDEITLGYVYRTYNIGSSALLTRLFEKIEFANNIVQR